MNEPMRIKVGTLKKKLELINPNAWTSTVDQQVQFEGYQQWFQALI